MVEQVTANQIRKVMSALGKKKSERKKKSSKANGKLGGRPRKTTDSK